MRHIAIGALVLALTLGAPAPAAAQVFLSSAPHPDFAVGPLFIVGTVRPDLGPVAVRVSWSIAFPPHRSAKDMGDLYLLWPGEVTAATAPGPPEPALSRHVEERGFTVVGGGQLYLESRDRTKLGTGADGDRVPEVASFVTFYKNGTNPAQSGMGTFIKIPWTPLLADPVSLLSLPMTVKDMIAPRPSTWVEELFWGRRYVLTLSAGSAGSLALYSMYFDQRDRVVRLARDFSLLLASFSDADHLRIDDMNPTSASRRPSRVRRGSETVSLPISAAEGAVPQLLKVQFSYFMGPFAWRPILVSLVLLILGNIMGALMFAQQLNRFFRRRFHFVSERARANPWSVPSPEVLRGVIIGSTTRAEVLALCGPPTEEVERHHSPATHTLLYRASQHIPHSRGRLGPLATVGHWDEEERQVEIVIENDRVVSVQTHVRRARLP